MSVSLTGCLVYVLALTTKLASTVTRFPGTHDLEFQPEITLVEPQGIRFAITGNTSDISIFHVYMNVNKPLAATQPYHDNYCQYHGYVFNIYPPADLVWTCADYSPRFGDIIYYSLKVVDSDSTFRNKYDLNMTILKDGNGRLVPVFGLPYRERMSIVLGSESSTQHS